MSGGPILPEDVIADLDERAAGLGEKAFPHNGRAHFYSGPSKNVGKRIAGSWLSNHERAKLWAERHNALIIDNTPLGQFLETYMEVGTFKYFGENPRIDPIFRDTAGVLPWKHLSRMFTLAMWGYVSTTVCGADMEDGVYGSVEFRHLMNPEQAGLPPSEFLRALFNPRKIAVEYINLIPYERVHSIYDADDIRPAHRLVCLGEQRMALHEALGGIGRASIKQAFVENLAVVLDNPLEAFEYFLESQERHRIDCALQAKETGASVALAYVGTPQTRLASKEHRRAHFANRLLQLTQVELAIEPVAIRPRLVMAPSIALHGFAPM